MEFAVIGNLMRQKGILFLFCVLCLGLFTFAQETFKKPRKFVLGINAGLGRWTSRVTRDVRISPLPSFPEHYSVVIADTNTDVNSHFGFNIKYNFSPKFGLQAEFNRINAEYLFLVGLNPKYISEQPRYDSVNLPWKVTTFYINGVFNFQEDRGKLFPFAFAGAGFNILHKNNASGEYMTLESKSSIDLGLKLGGGLGLYPRGAALGFELRGYLLYLKAYDVSYSHFQSYTNSTPGFSSENIVWAVDLGIKYRF